MSPGQDAHTLSNVNSESSPWIPIVNPGRDACALSNVNENYANWKVIKGAQIMHIQFAE